MGREEDEILLRAGAQMNLGRILDFHMQADFALLERANRWRRKDTEGAKHLVEQCEVDYRKLLRQATFLMIFGYLEEMLWVFSGIQKVQRDDTEKGLDRFKPVVRKVLGDKWPRSKSWAFIKDASQVRNTILHAAGRPKLMDNPEKIEAVVRKHKSCYALPGARVEILENGVESLREHAEDLILELTVLR